MSIFLIVASWLLQFSSGQPQLIETVETRTCILLTTGTDPYDSGTVTMKINGDIIIDDQKFAKGESWNQCFDFDILTMTLQGSSKNAWAGVVEIKADSVDGVLLNFACDGCADGSGPPNKMVLDGDHDAADFDMGALTCLNGKVCSILIAPPPVSIRYPFQLRGDTGEEIVSIFDGDMVFEVTLTTDWVDYEAENPTIRINFENDNGPRNPHFRSDYETQITWDREDEFRCEMPDEDQVRCNHIRTGFLAWPGFYTVVFKSVRVEPAGPMDCAGVRGGSAVEDECGICGGDGSTCPVDCAGVRGGSAVEDECGVCGGEGNSCVGLHECQWMDLDPTPVGILPSHLHHDPHNELEYYFGFTCNADKIMTGFKLHDDLFPSRSLQGNPYQVQCCDMFGHSAVTIDFELDSGTSESIRKEASCDATDHMALCGVYDELQEESVGADNYLQTYARKCCKIACDTTYCAQGDWGIDHDSCEIITAEYQKTQGYVDLLCPAEMIMTKVIDLPSEHRITGINFIHQIECCPLDIVPPPSMEPTMNPTSSPSKTPTVNPTVHPTVHPTVSPSKTPTVNPTVNPSVHPTTDPSLNPTMTPTFTPTTNPTRNPTVNPSVHPTTHPTVNPSSNPTKNPTVHPTMSPTKNPSPSPSRPPTTIDQCLLEKQRCTLPDGRFLETVENCLDERILETCILLETGTNTDDTGDLTLRVNGDIIFDRKNFDHKDTWSQCFLGFVDDITLQGPTNNAWAGKIQLTYNGEPHTLTCDDCGTGTGPFNTWVFDGNDDSAYMGATTCLNGKECAITVDSTDACDSTDVSVVDCATIEGAMKIEGNRVGVPNGQLKGPDGNNLDGVIRFSFYCEEPTTVTFEGWVFGPNGADDSFMVSVNGGSKRAWYFQHAVAAGADVFTTETWRHVGEGKDSETDQGRYYWQVQAEYSELELFPREDGAFVTRMRIVRGSDVCKFTKQADGLVTEESLGLMFGENDDRIFNEETFFMALQSSPYQMAVHGLASVGALALAVKAFTSIRLKQDYATISEHEI